jgi:hypothetical protein
MSNLFNLNISEYNNKELEELFEINFPYTKNDVGVCGEKMKVQLFKDPTLKEGDKDKVILFIEQATNQLSKTLTDAVLEPKLKRSEVIDAGGHMIIKKKESRFALSSSQSGGTINPLSTTMWDNTRKLKNQIVNIDTVFRNNYYNTKATDFHMTLPLVMKNVVSMEVVACELPLSIYAVSNALGNNSFVVKWLGILPTDPSGITRIVIPDGNYSDGMIQCGGCHIDASANNPASMAWQLNFQLGLPDSSGGTGGLVKASIDQRTGKIIIAAATDAINVSQIQLFFNLDENLQIVEKPIQTKLGWMLGYRFAEYVGSTAYITEGRYDFRGPRYLYLVVNDYNNNHAESIVGAFSQSLTVPENILARLTWKEYAFFATDNYPLNNTQKNGGRFYFGPVDIQKLHIQLVDQYGRIISLNNMDWALALNFSMLYKV